MMKQMQQSVVALALCGAISVPAMAASTDVKVTGTITPAGCTPTLSGGGVVDYGNIRADNLSATFYTVLAEKDIDFSIKCDAPAKIAIKATEGRPNTAAGVDEEGFGGVGVLSMEVRILNQYRAYVAGLGLDGNKRIGGYGILLLVGQTTADGQSVNTLVSSDIATGWQQTNSTHIFDPYGPRYLSWSQTGSVTPLAIRNFSSKLRVQAYLNKTSELDLSKAITLDGLTTLELIYL